MTSAPGDAPAPARGSPSGRERAFTVALLVAGIVAAAVYVVGDLVDGLRYAHYRFLDQAISELSAYSSPVRSSMLTFLTLHGLLLVAFGVGVWRAAASNRWLRWVGELLLAAAVVGLVLHPAFPMGSRGMKFGFNDTMHIVLTGVFVFLVIGAVACASVAYPGWFRYYCLASLLVMAAAGWLAAEPSRDLAENRPTPWLGAFERVNAYVYLAWLVVLAVTVIRHVDPEDAARS